MILCATAAAVAYIWSRRDSRLRKLVKTLKAEKVTSEHVKSLRYDFLLPMLQHKLIPGGVRFNDLTLFLRKPATVLVTKACLEEVLKECVIRHGGSVKISARVFLAAYMIAFRKTKVFETIGERERVLFLCAGPLVEEFDVITNAILAGGDFSAVPYNISARFIPLLEEYVRRFAEWKVPDEERLVRRIKDALIALYLAESQLEFGVTDLCREFTKQIDRLRERLATIAGAEALTAFDVERRGHIVGPRRRSRFPVRMTNEHLTHELMYDRNFQLAENMAFNWEWEHSVRVREQFSVDFWEGLLEDLRVVDVVKAVRVLEDIRSGIREVFPEENVFNEDQIETPGNLLDNKVLIVDSIADVIARKQGVTRALNFAAAWATLRFEIDTEIDKALVFRNALRFLHDCVNKMRMDFVNANLRVVNNGVDYERSKFQSKLDDGTLTLDRTTEWLEGVMPVDADTKRTYLKAMVNLVASVMPVTEDVCPETLLLDWPRLAQVQQDFHEWGLSVPEVFASLEALQAEAAPMAAPSPAFKVAENLNLIVNVNWGVHADMYEGILV